MDRETLKRWKAGMEEANRLDREKRLRRTPAERFRLHQVFLERQGRLGLAGCKPQDRVHKTPYSEIRERWIARHP